MEIKTVGLACDHAGFPLKQFVLDYLEKKGYPVKDFGTYSDKSVDYPDLKLLSLEKSILALLFVEAVKEWP